MDEGVAIDSWKTTQAGGKNMGTLENTQHGGESVWTSLKP